MKKVCVVFMYKDNDGSLSIGNDELSYDGPLTMNVILQMRRCIIDKFGYQEVVFLNLIPLEA